MKGSWLVLGGPTLAVTAWTGLENTTLTLLSGCMTTNSADNCMLVMEWARSRSQVCLIRLEVDLGSGFMSELGQKCCGCV